MWSILDAAGFLDPPLTFTYRKMGNHYSLIIEVISVHKVYIEFELKC